jgi:hypothetical protein
MVYCYLPYIGIEPATARFCHNKICIRRNNLIIVHTKLGVYIIIVEMVFAV